MGFAGRVCWPKRVCRPMHRLGFPPWRGSSIGRPQGRAGLPRRRDGELEPRVGRAQPETPRRALPPDPYRPFLAMMQIMYIERAKGRFAFIGGAGESRIASFSALPPWPFREAASASGKGKGGIRTVVGGTIASIDSWGFPLLSAICLVRHRHIFRGPGPHPSADQVFPSMIDCRVLVLYA